MILVLNNLCMNVLHLSAIAVMMFELIVIFVVGIVLINVRKHLHKLATLQYGRNPLLFHRAGTEAASYSLESRFPLPGKRQALPWQARYSPAKVSHSHFCARLFLAWPQEL